jgi:hypothetical protein
MAMTVGKGRKRYRNLGSGSLHDEVRPGRPRTDEDDKVAEMINRPGPAEQARRRQLAVDNSLFGGCNRQSPKAQLLSAGLRLQIRTWRSSSAFALKFLGICLTGLNPHSILRFVAILKCFLKLSNDILMRIPTLFLFFVCTLSQASALAGNCFDIKAGAAVEWERPLNIHVDVWVIPIQASGRIDYAQTLQSLNSNPPPVSSAYATCDSLGQPYLFLIPFKCTNKYGSSNSYNASILGASSGNVTFLSQNNLKSEAVMDRSAPKLVCAKRQKLTFAVGYLYHAKSAVVVYTKSSVNFSSENYRVDPDAPSPQDYRF